MSPKLERLLREASRHDEAASRLGYGDSRRQEEYYRKCAALLRAVELFPGNFLSYAEARRYAIISVLGYPLYSKGSPRFVMHVPVETEDDHLDLATGFAALQGILLPEPVKVATEFVRGWPEDPRRSRRRSPRPRRRHGHAAPRRQQISLAGIR